MPSNFEEATQRLAAKKERWVNGEFQTHTVVELELSEQAYEEIARKLRGAGYDHVFLDNDNIDMNGIAVRKEDGDD